MKYTNQEYAEKALEANNKGKLLIVNDDNELELIDIVKTESDIILENSTKRDFLLQESNEKIAILQDIVDLDMQESNEDEQLKAWKKYRILLTRIDTNNIKITWPEKPQ